MAGDTSLKEGNERALAGYMFVHALFVGWATLGLPFTTSAFSATGALEWEKAGSAVVVVLLVTLINRLGGSEFKARIVLWRFRNPLPGSRAFSEIASRDSRVDLNRLRGAVGAFPTDGAEQNRKWYALSLKHGDKPAVRSGHKDYLQFRDMAWLSLVILLVGPAILFLGPTSDLLAAPYALACVLLYLGARTAAVTAGERFVGSVLACEGASAPEQPSAIVRG